jgi:outer membrane protein assembly factor BamD (BamD/ComL family)
MSPEQARAEPLDARSDLFSFGVVLYEMITGQQAFSGPSTAVVFDGILNRTPPPVSLIASEIPPALEQILARLLQKDREQRYQSAAELRADLERLRRVRESGSSVAASAMGIPALPPAPSTPAAAPVSQPHVVAVPAAAPKAPSRMRMLMAGVAAIGVVAMTVVAGIRWVARREAGPPPPTAAVMTAAPQAERSGTAAGASAAPAERPGETTAPVAGAAPSTTPAETPAPAAPVEDGRPGGRVPAAPARAVPGRSTSQPQARAASAEPRRPAVRVPGAAAASQSGVQARSTDAAATLLGVAKAKYDTRLFDQALADLRTITTEHAASPSAPVAYLLIGQIHEEQSRPADAMAAYVELRSRNGGTEEEAQATYRLAELTLRSKRPDRVKVARDLLAEIPARHSASGWALRALTAKAALETRERVKEPDAVVGGSAPAALATNRLLVERYPGTPQAEAALWQLGEGYEGLKRYDLAAAAFKDLGSRYARTRYDAWWRAGEIYEKRLKDKFAAREAYGKVPVSSPNYATAQKRAR